MKRLSVFESRSLHTRAGEGAITGAQTGSNDSWDCSRKRLSTLLFLYATGFSSTVISEWQKRNKSKLFTLGEYSCNMRNSGFLCVIKKKKKKKKKDSSSSPPFLPPFGSVRLHCFNVVQVNSLLPSSVHRRWSHCRTRELFLSIRKKNKNRAFHFYTPSPVIETFKDRHPGLQTSLNFDVHTL